MLEAVEFKVGLPHIIPGVSITGDLAFSVSLHRARYPVD